MRDDTGKWTPEAKRHVWSKAPLADPNDPDGMRLDPCGALISLSEYGNRQSPFGWEMEHVMPAQYLRDHGVSEELIDHPDNLRPMQWQNNATKGDSLLIYSANTTRLGEINFPEANRDYCVNRSQIDKVRRLYSAYVDITHPTILGQYAAEVGIEAPSTYFDPIITPSIHDLP